MKLSQSGAFRKPRASSALIVVLLAVVLATLIILAILSGAQLERQTAYYYAERMRADALAQSGLQQAVGLLWSNMRTNEFWVTGPGRLMTATYSTTSPFVTYSSSLDLSSGTNTAVPTGVWAPPNLNSENIDGTYPLAGDQSVMNVRWIYVRQNGTLDNSDTPNTSSGQSPIIGRYAFWIDDSSSRVNLNTAWTRAGATNGLGDVARVDLSTLAGFSGTVPNDTHFYATNNLFNSDYDLRTNELVDAVSSNRFAYTVYNHSSDGLNPFGQPKICLTTQTTNLPAGLTSITGYTNYYLRILNNDSGNGQAAGNDPGVAANLNDSYISHTVNNLYSYLTNANWPEYPGVSFAQKYYGSNTDPRIFQLAVNIVEYVRAKESQQKVMSAIRGYVSGGVFTSQTVTPLDSDSQSVFGDLNHPTPIIGATRTPYITELTTYWAPGSGTPAYIVLQAEVYLPPNIGIDSLAGSDFSFGHQYDFTNAYTTNSSSSVIDESDRWFGLGYGGGPDSAPPSNDQFYLKSGSSFPLTAANPYAVIIAEKNQGSSGESVTNSGFAGKPATTFYLQGAIAPANANTSFSSAAGADYWHPSALSASKAVGPILVGAAQTTPSANSYQIDDPLTGVVATNWQFKPSTWGARNSIVTVGSSPTNAVPPQDTDSSGLVTAVGWRMPYPYGYALVYPASSAGFVPNPSGKMESLAELGYVNTGMLCWTNSDGKVGVPYRTLRLQPTSGGTILPDWALLDLFQLPAQSANFNYQPVSPTDGSNPYDRISGRVNINALLYPFTNVSRLTPLMAELTGATNPIAGTTMPASQAAQMATNIAQMNLSGNGHAYAITNGYYTSIGQLAEISGMADSGEQSEGNLFEPLAQTTVTGNVFTVYTIGQALKQLPSGSISVTGEKRFEATVERNPTKTSSPLFRTIVVREVTP